MRCGLEGCIDTPLYGASFCWNHIADKEGYRVQLSEMIARGSALNGANFSKANLSKANLSGAVLFDANMEGTELLGANLSRCDLTHCVLRGADLTKADISDSRLWNADLRGAKMAEANLRGADLWNASLFKVRLWRTDFAGARSLTRKNFSADAKFFSDPMINEEGLLSAEESYRDLKSYFLSNGMYGDAGWASFKEKTMERLIFKKNRDITYLPSMLMNILCGYGEKPHRIVISSISTILIFALAYLLFNAIESSISKDYVMRLSDYIYYSTVTFTTVGYGDFIPKASGFFRLLAAGEAFIGTFLTGLFIFTLARKYSAH